MESLISIIVGIIALLLGGGALLSLRQQRRKQPVPPSVREEEIEVREAAVDRAEEQLQIIRNDAEQMGDQALLDRLDQMIADRRRSRE